MKSYQNKKNIQTLSLKSMQKKPILSRLKTLVIFSFAIIAVTGGVFSVYAKKQHVEATSFGLDNDYEKIMQMNDRLANVVPIPIETISLTQTGGDKRVVALLMFLEKYKAPMATPAVAKAFIENADKNGFGDRWMLLPAIAGVESGFGRLIPHKVVKKNTVLSYNAWGWGGPGNWAYFSSWEDAVEKISRGLANGYGVGNLTPERMMASYCPPCAASGGSWAKGVKGYMADITATYQSL